MLFWPTAPVAPGDTGAIVAEYSAEHRLLEFEKIYVDISGSRESVELTLLGAPPLHYGTPLHPMFSAWSEYRPGDTLYVLAQTGLTLREPPRPDGKKIATLPFASALTVLEENLGRYPHRAEAFQGFDIAGHWIKVSTGHGKSGYVFDGFLSRFAAPEPLKVKEWLHEQFGLKSQSFQEGYPTLLNKQVFHDGTTCQFYNVSEDGKYYDFAIRFGASMTLAEGWLLARALLFGKEKNRSDRKGNKIYLYPAAGEGRMMEVRLYNGQVEIASSQHMQEGCGH